MMNYKPIKDNDMKIETGKWVELQYELYAYTDGEPEELMMSTPEGEPEKFVYGVDEAVLPVFMEKIAGLKAGDKFDFTIPAEQAFGLRNENHIMKLDRNLFLNPEGELDNRVKSGATLPMHTTDGVLVYGLVLMVEKDGVTIDFNHPLAGENLHYKGEVKLVRDATEEELNPPHSCGCCSGCGSHDHGCDDGCCGGCGSHEC